WLRESLDAVHVNLPERCANGRVPAQQIGIGDLRPRPETNVPNRRPSVPRQRPAARRPTAGKPADGLSQARPDLRSSEERAQDLLHGDGRAPRLVATFAPGT